MELDHLVVAGETLEDAVRFSEGALGLPLVAGGEHVHFGTHNRVLGLEGREYFEAISVNPEAGVLGRPRWFGLDHFSGPARLITWVCRVESLERALEIWPEAGEVVALSRGELRWRMAVPEGGRLSYGGVMPLLIEWDGDVHPCDGLGSCGLGIGRLTLAHPDAGRAGELLERLGLKDNRIEVSEGDAPAIGAALSGPSGHKRL